MSIVAILRVWKVFSTFRSERRDALLTRDTERRLYLFSSGNSILSNEKEGPGRAISKIASLKAFLGKTRSRALRNREILANAAGLLDEFAPSRFYGSRLVVSAVKRARTLISWMIIKRDLFGNRITKGIIKVCRWSPCNSAGERSLGHWIY